MLREEISDALSQVLDLERLITRVLYKTAGARELRAICQTAAVIPQLANMLLSSRNDELINIAQGIDTLKDIFDLIDNAIVESPPFSVREGGMIKTGYSSELDELHEIVSDSRKYLDRIAENERERTGISKLKIR